MFKFENELTNQVVQETKEIELINSEINDFLNKANHHFFNSTHESNLSLKVENKTSNSISYNRY